MTNEQYQETQKALIEIVTKVHKLRLDEFLKSINTAETMAPFIDPTLYRKASNNLSAIKNVAKACVDIQRLGYELIESVVDTASNGYMMTKSAERTHET